MPTTNATHPTAVVGAEKQSIVSVGDEDNPQSNRDFNLMREHSREERINKEASANIRLSFGFGKNKIRIISYNISSQSIENLIAKEHSH